VASTFAEECVPEELLFDQYTPLSFKAAIGNTDRPGIAWTAPTWVGDEGRRRLSAYKLLQAYLDNASREFIGDLDPESRDRHREYGDAALIRDTTLAALLGNEVHVSTDGAADFDPDSDEEQDADAEAAFNFQSWMEEWADNERFRLKLMEVERSAVGLGDGVYTLGFSPEKGRVRLRVWDPGFYFPVLGDDDEDYPRKVHLAWELPGDPAQPGRVQIRRLTWELGAIQPLVSVDGSLLPSVRPGPGDKMDRFGRVTRQYAWNDEPSTETCYYSDGTWTIDTADRDGVTRLADEDGSYASYFDEAAGEFRELRRVDLRIDFLPVVHIPNTVAVINHYGQSTLSRVLQIIDDLTNADTDMQAAAATSARPVLALEGGTMGSRVATYAPGEVWEVGGGKLSAVDTTAALAALQGLVDALWKRLSANSRIPESLLGRIAPSEVPSGVALALSFGPLSSMIAEMRLARSDKYPLLFKFAWRMSVANGVEDVPVEYRDTDLEFGAFLPMDKDGIATTVAALLAAKAISRKTGVRWLRAAGWDVESVDGELRDIQHYDFEAAGELLDLTGNIEAAVEYLGREGIKIELPPPPDVPPVPNDGTGVPPAPGPQG
jgi:hypothetical protein